MNPGGRARRLADGDATAVDILLCCLIPLAQRNAAVEVVCAEKNEDCFRIIGFYLDNLFFFQTVFFVVYVYIIFIKIDFSHIIT